MRKTFTLALILSILLLPGCAAPAGPAATAVESFIFLSDTQAAPEAPLDYSGYAALLEQALAMEPQSALLLLGGDSVNDGNDEAEWAAFRAAALDGLPDLTVLAALGNHDDNARTYAQLPPPPQASVNEDAPGFLSYESRLIHFLILDGNRLGAANAADIAWVEADLQAAQRPWIVAVCHQPPYPAIAIPKDQQRAAIMQQHLVPLLQRYGVAVMLSGHQHTYMRSYPLLDGAEDAAGISYFCVNSGGKSYSAGSFPYIAASSDRPCALLAIATEQSLTLRAIDSSGSVIDEYAIERITDEN